MGRHNLYNRIRDTAQSVFPVLNHSNIFFRFLPIQSQNSIGDLGKQSEGRCWPTSRLTTNLTRIKLMEPRDGLTNPSSLIAYVILFFVGVLFIWWNTTSTFPKSKVHFIVFVLLQDELIIPQTTEKATELNPETCVLYQDVDGQVARTKQARTGRCLLSLGNSISRWLYNFSDIQVPH